MSEESGVLSLAEIKAQNIAEEDALLNKGKESQDDDFEEVEEKPAAKQKPKEVDSSDDDEDEDEDDDSPKEDWMKGDDDDEEDDDGDDVKIDSKFAQVRKKYQAKYKGKLDEAEDELEKLRQENELLKKGGPKPTASQPKLPPKPERNRFQREDDYLDALTDWKYDLREAQRHSNEIANQYRQTQEQDAQETEQQVESHYTRAAKLSESAGITPERYQTADRRVRAAVEAKFPGAGDAIIDELIASTGDGSERVFYNLGVNKDRLNEFVESLGKNKGLKTAAFLGKLTAQLAPPKRRTSQAPDPASNVSGDKRGGNMAAAKRKYKEAHKAGDSQTAFSIKREAKKSGVDTSSW